MSRPVSFESVSVDVDIHRETEPTTKKRSLKVALVATGAGILLVLITVILVVFLRLKDDSDANPLIESSVLPVLEQNDTVTIIEDKQSKGLFYPLIQLIRVHPKRSIGIITGFLVLVAIAVTLGVILSRSDNLEADQIVIDDPKEEEMDQQDDNIITEDSTLSAQTIGLIVGGVAFALLLIVAAIVLGVIRPWEKKTQTKQLDLVESNPLVIPNITEGKEIAKSNITTEKKENIPESSSDPSSSDKHSVTKSTKMNDHDVVVEHFDPYWKHFYWEEFKEEQIPYIKASILYNITVLNCLSKFFVTKHAEAKYNANCIGYPRISKLQSLVTPDAVQMYGSAWNVFRALKYSPLKDPFVVTDYIHTTIYFGDLDPDCYYNILRAELFMEDVRNQGIKRLESIYNMVNSLAASFIGRVKNINNTHPASILEHMEELGKPKKPELS